MKLKIKWQPLGWRRPAWPALSVIALLLTVSVHTTEAETTLPSSGTLSINTENIPPVSTPAGTGFEDLIARELYRRLGYDVKFHILPAERGLVNVNDGIDDGILSRVGGMSDRYPNLVQIDENVSSTDYVAFSRLADVRLTSWQSLTPYTVAIVNGWKIFERNVTNTRSLTKVRNVEQLFTLLDIGRVDIVLFSRLSGLQQITNLKLKGVHVLETPLAIRKKYFYLNRKHRALAARASDVLKDMKADGTFQKYYDLVIAPLANN